MNGTVNANGDTDKGWSVEIALPWKGLKPLADGKPLPPKPGDVWRVDCSRFQHRGPKGERLERAAGWTWNRHGYYDSHIPETFTYVRLSGEVAGASRL